MAIEYVVGVDGGGTKTAGLLADRQGHILAREFVGPTNYQIVGSEGIAEQIPKLVRRLWAQAGIGQGQLASIALGLAGVGRPGEPQRVTALVRDLGLARDVVVDHDAMIALVGALGDRPGLIIIAGTGSIVLGRNARGQTVRVGGWGYMLGDEGSGFFIAREALMAVLRAHDGRGRETILTSKIIQELKLRGPEQIVPRVYRQGMSHTEMADLAPCVFQAAREGDLVAREILDRAGRELGLMASAAIQRLGMGADVVRIGMVGSLFKSRELLLEAMRASLEKGIRVEFIMPRLSPAGGAIIMALKAAGEKISSQLLDRLEAELKRGTTLG